jgi:acetolactate synthase-like protein
MPLQGRGSLQDVDQLSILRSLCKYSASVSTLLDLAPTLRAAFQAARSGVPGPVFVEIPIDILYPYSTVKKELMNMEFKGILGSITKAFITRHIKQTYSGVPTDPALPPLPVDIPMPSSASVTAAARLVRHAKKPVLLIGSQATLEVKRIPELVAAAKSLGIPTYVSGMARGLLGHEEELWFRQNRANALKNADVIILCGTVCDFRLKYGGSLSRKANVCHRLTRASPAAPHVVFQIIAVNRSSEDLHKNSDLLGGKWKATVSCLGDPLSFLVDLAKIVIPIPLPPAVRSSR